MPELPPHYLPRAADLAGLKQKLLAGGANVGNYGTILGRGCAGNGRHRQDRVGRGIGTCDSETRQAFSDGIYWLTIGQKPNLLDLQNRLLRQLTGSKETLTTEEEAKDALREALEGRPALACAGRRLDARCRGCVSREPRRVPAWSAHHYAQQRGPGRARRRGASRRRPLAGRRTKDVGRVGWRENPG